MPCYPAIENDIVYSRMIKLKNRRVVLQNLVNDYGFILKFKILRDFKKRKTWYTSITLSHEAMEALFTLYCDCLQEEVVREELNKMTPPVIPES